MANIKIINAEVEKILGHNEEVMFVKSPTTPTLTFSHASARSNFPRRKIGTPNIILSSHFKSYYIFLLGIKTFTKYHLNVVTYNKRKNTIERFDPCGVDDSEKNINIKIYVVKYIVNMFELLRSPLYKDNGLNITQHINESNCVDLCLRHIKTQMDIWTLGWSLNANNYNICSKP
jgi:hypothetical protein